MLSLFATSVWFARRRAATSWQQWAGERRGDGSHFGVCRGRLVGHDAAKSVGALTRSAGAAYWSAFPSAFGAPVEISDLASRPFRLGGLPRPAPQLGQIAADGRG